MSRLLGLMIFSIGIGLVIGLWIHAQLIQIIVAAVLLLLGYHLFCN